jgi:hypothetical protein
MERKIIDAHVIRWEISDVKWGSPSDTTITPETPGRSAIGKRPRRKLPGCVG